MVVDYTTNGDTVAALFDAVVDAVAPARRFFRSEGQMLFIRRGVSPLAVTEKNRVRLLRGRKSRSPP